MSEKKWYVLNAYAGYEKRVQTLIEEQLKLQNMEHLVEEFFIPQEEVTTKKKDKTRKSKLTYYPGYILIKMDLTKALWHLMNSVDKVSGFIGGDPANPLPVSNKELEAIRGQIESGVKQKEIDSTYTVGQSVVVIEGAFIEFKGTIGSVDLETNRLIVNVNIFGRETPLELDFDKVRPAE